MNKHQKEVELTKISHEQKAFQELKKTYTQALADTKAMVKKLQEDVSILESSNLGDESILRSRIYQLNYQKAMEEQLTAICDVVNSKNVTNVQTFLTKMYQDSYLGVNYNLQKSGIPVLMAVNPSLIVKSINTPTNNLKFSETLYKRTQELKKAYKEEISRGIATGKGYKEIARQLDQKTKIGFNNAYRITRTEGGRVSSEASMTAMRDAKAKGADIVKQWIATLDMRTRDAHGRLDGQIREIEEDFEIDGYEAQCPHGFGYPEMDINCRCAVLSVPRWDIDAFNVRYDDQHKTLIETQNFQDWKNKYYRVIEQRPEVLKVMLEAEERIKGYQTYKTVIKEVSDRVDKALGKTLKEYNINYQDSLQNLDANLLEENKQQLNNLVSMFPKAERYVDANTLGLGTFNGQDGDFGYTSSNLLNLLSKQEIKLNENMFSNYDELIALQKKYMKNGWSMPCSDKYLNVYALTHEFGHVMSNVLVNEYIKENMEEFLQKKSLAFEYDPQMAAYMMRTYHNNIVKGYLKEIQEIAMKKDKDFTWDKYLSDYGQSDYQEAFAEAFANSQCGKPNLLGEAMNEWLEKRFK